MSDRTSNWIAQIEERIQELRPLVVEHDRLSAALAAMTDGRRGPRAKRARVKPAASPQVDVRAASQELVADARR